MTATPTSTSPTVAPLPPLLLSFFHHHHARSSQHQHQPQQAISIVTPYFCVSAGLKFQPLLRTASVHMASSCRARQGKARGAISHEGSTRIRFDAHGSYSLIYTSITMRMVKRNPSHLVSSHLHFFCSIHILSSVLHRTTSGNR